jgi:Fe-S-cluster containining protein
MADSGQFTATLRLTVGELKIAHPITVPSAAVPATEVVPALQGLVNAVVAAAETGKAISCRKGCGACCRQLVPLSRTEGERLVALIDVMPEPRRAAVLARFADAAAALERAGLSAALLDPAKRAGKSDRDSSRSDRELSLAYFAQHIACPFLEEESCSIHPDRPLVCREYLVTSPAELCAGPSQEGVTPVAVPKVSPAARGLEESRPEVDTSGRWFPLALLMEWAKTRPRGATCRPGPEWIQRFVRRIAAR